jgi:hypothetical protein
MAQRNEVGCLFGGHDACDTCHTQYVAFLVVTLPDVSQGGRLHVDPAFGDGPACGRLFISDVNHVGFAGGVEMC